MNVVERMPASAHLSPAEVAARSGSNFLAGFVCLDAERRAGMTAVYAFCRVADDAVDDAPDAATGRAHLEFWRGELAAAAGGEPRTPVGRALCDTMRRFGSRREHFDALLDGVAMDLESRGIADEAELRLYCARVASAVGRASLPVLGATAAGAVAFADSLGQALQLTNILRDLRPDAEVGRVYVPRQWLAELGVDAAMLRTGEPTPALQRLCDRLVGAASVEFEQARRHLAALPREQRRALVPARIMGAVYGALLRRLVRRGADLRGGRVRVPRLHKSWLAFRVLLGATA